MPITTLPTQTEGSLGQVKTNLVGAPYDPVTDVNADIQNEHTARIVEVFQEVGLSDGSTPGSLREAVNGRVPASRTISTAGLATGGGDLSANRTVTVSPGLVGDIAAVGSAAVAGSTGRAADAGHVHAHGSQTDPTMHAGRSTDIC